MIALVEGVLCLNCMSLLVVASFSWHSFLLFFKEQCVLFECDFEELQLYGISEERI